MAIIEEGVTETTAVPLPVVHIRRKKSMCEGESKVEGRNVRTREIQK